MAEELPPFVKLRLWSRTGEDLVAAVDTPAFQTRPELVYWGQRLFTWSSEHGRYCEAVGWYVVPTTPAGEVEVDDCQHPHA